METKVNPVGRSETSKCRARLAPYCVGHGLDVGFGGDSIVPHAINCDRPNPYTSVGGDPQHIKCDAFSLNQIFREESLDFIYSSHLVEDFEWNDLVRLIMNWRKLLVGGGRLVIYCPDEQVYRAHCERTGQGYNKAHKNADFSLSQFKKKVVTLTGPWIVAHEGNYPEEYSWEIVLVKG